MKKLHRAFGILLLFVGVSRVVVSSSTPCEFPAVFNFGDSNSDSGGLSAAFGPVPPPQGETFFHRPAGRYCDGRLIIDFIAKSLGLPYVSAYLDSLGTNFTHGANFATAGSTVRRPNMTIFQSRQSPFSLDVQFSHYSQFRPRSQIIYNQGGFFQNLMPREDYFFRALYTLDIGQNDLTSGFFHYNMTIPQVIAYTPDVVNLISLTIKSIYLQGGRYFWVHNTGPFGCLAYFIVRRQIPERELGKDGCATQYNKVAQNFNEKLRQAMQQLGKDLPLAAITYVDVYSAKYSLISQAKNHGFEEPIRACCGHGGRYNYDPNMGCGSSVLAGSCPDPSVYVNWDGVHYTEAANHWVFNRIVNGTYSDPPLPLDMACHKPRL